MMGFVLCGALTRGASAEVQAEGGGGRGGGEGVVDVSKMAANKTVEAKINLQTLSPQLKMHNFVIKKLVKRTI